MAIRQQPTARTAIVEARFGVTNPSFPFVGLSAFEDCEIELEEMLPQRGDRYRAVYSVEGSDPRDVLQRAAGYDGSAATLIDRYGDFGLLELTVSGECPVMYLAEAGAYPRRVRADGGTGRITALVLPDATDADVLETFVSAFPTADLLSHRQRSHYTPMFSLRELDGILQEHLSDRQLESLEAAHQAGYYRWPRETTGEELAAVMGIAPATLAEHLRAAEQKLVTLFLE